MRVRPIDQHAGDEFRHGANLYRCLQFVKKHFKISKPGRVYPGVLNDSATQESRLDSYRAHFSFDRRSVPAVVYFIFLNLVWVGAAVLTTSENVFASLSTSSGPVLVASVLFGSMAILLGWIAFAIFVPEALKVEGKTFLTHLKSCRNRNSMLSLGLLTRSGQTRDGATIFVINLAHIGQVVLHLPLNVTIVSLFCAVSTTCFIETPLNTIDSVLRAFSCIFAAMLIYCHERNLFDSFSKLSDISNKYDDARVTADIEGTSAARNLGELRLVIGNTAHDLKTPLQAFSFSTTELITSLTQIKQMCDDDNEKRSFNDSLNLMVFSAIESAQNLTTYSEFMNMSINRSLDFSKSANGIHLSPTFTSFNLVDAIKYPVECIRAIQVRIPIVLELDTPTNEHIITDGHWLKDNLICLLSNAVKYSIDGDVRLRCKVITWADNEGLLEKFLRFEVEDHGIGISELHRIKLFQPFARIQNQAGGTGLGLYSLSKRIQALGGTFGIEGRSDGTGGTLVWFTIPYRQDSMHDDKHRPATCPPSSEGSFDFCGPDVAMMQSANGQVIIKQGSRGSVREQVLIVDDSPMILKMLKRSLEAASYNVVVAENGAEACARYDEQDGKFDAIITDIQMPVMDGIELTVRIRAREALCPTEIHTPIIGMSANSEGSTRDQFLAAGADFLISKPFVASTILSLLSKVIKNQEKVEVAQAMQTTAWSGTIAVIALAVAETKRTADRKAAVLAGVVEEALHEVIRENELQAESLAISVANAVNEALRVNEAESASLALTVAATARENKMAYDYEALLLAHNVAAAVSEVTRAYDDKAAALALTVASAAGDAMRANDDKAAALALDVAAASFDAARDNDDKAAFLALSVAAAAGDAMSAYNDKAALLALTVAEATVIMARAYDDKAASLALFVAATACEASRIHTEQAASLARTVAAAAFEVRIANIDKAASLALEVAAAANQAVRANDDKAASLALTVAAAAGEMLRANEDKAASLALTVAEAAGNAARANDTKAAALALSVAIAADIAMQESDNKAALLALAVATAAADATRAQDDKAASLALNVAAAAGKMMRGYDDKAASLALTVAAAAGEMMRANDDKAASLALSVAAAAGEMMRANDDKAASLALTVAAAADEILRANDNKAALLALTVAATASELMRANDDKAALLARSVAAASCEATRANFNKAASLALTVAAAAGETMRAIEYRAACLALTVAAAAEDAKIANDNKAAALALKVAAAAGDAMKANDDKAAALALTVKAAAGELTRVNDESAASERLTKKAVAEDAWK